MDRAIEVDQRDTMKIVNERASRVLGSILLVAGCCVGVGMLGLPVVTATAGFWPSTGALLGGWLFMIGSGWLLLEVALWFPNDTSVIEMARRQLGPVGAAVAWGCWMFLLYALMVAYVIGSGSSIQELLSHWISLPPFYGSAAFVSLLAITLVYGTRACDHLNRIFMIGLFAGYGLIVMLGVPHISPQFLTTARWSVALSAFPVAVVSFGFHNLTPTLVYYLERHKGRLRLSIIVGSLLPLLGYLVWQYVALGLVPASAYQDAVAEGLSVTQVLARTLGQPKILLAAQLFGFSAIVTSFIATALSMMDFLRDSMRIKANMQNRWLLCGLVLAPCLAIAWAFPGIFLKALTYAGAYGAITLFGILPAMMVLKGSSTHKRSKYSWLAVLILLTSIALIVLQIALDYGLQL